MFKDVAAMPRLSTASDKAKRRAYALLSVLSLGIGGLGVVTPLLPTTPFVLLAAWAAARGHPGLHRWLHEHPRFGPLLRHWSEERAIPVRAKRLAVVMIAVSWLLLWYLLTDPLAVGAAGLVMAGVALYIGTRPTPHSSHE
jgi:uncharacterized membrane protein YbaN (DUF454 family)